MRSRLPAAVLERIEPALRRPMVVALLVAGAVAGVLGLAVLAVWTEVPGGSPAPAPRLPAALATPTATDKTGDAGGLSASAPGPTPTPRVVAPRRSSPPPVAIATTTQTEPPPTATVKPIAPPPTATATAAPSPTAAPDYEAAGGDALGALAGRSWAIVEDQLVNEGASEVAEPWVTVPERARGSAYAVEAEIRVRGLAEGVCDQNFGIVAGPEGGVVWGGGVLYGCDGEARARLTDVSDWTDGYDRDRPLAAKMFEPDRGWHTYRLEVRGNQLRLLIDGQPVLEATDAAAGSGGDRGAQVGVWSQGARIAVRRIAIYRL